ncbi:MAG: M4 family metallopeptidase [Bacteroidetes bacterium]|nr:M4 family metallopeptidase [Bacteroidota bacterium]MBS1757614.1 M4 family metallopeptidase [Bacteroidota bacterium]
MKKILPIMLFTVSCILTNSVFSQGTFRQVNDLAVQSIENNRKTDAPYSVMFKETNSFKKTDAQQLFVKYLNLKNGTDELRFLKDDNDKVNDITISKYQQYYKGIKVEHGTYVITSKKGRVSFMMGDFYTIDANTSITPTLSEDAARTKAWIYEDGAEPSDAVKAKAELVFVENDFQKELDGKVHLAYKFIIDSRTKALSIKEVYIDAATGDLLFENLTTNTGCFDNKKINNNLLPQTKVEPAKTVSFFSPQSISPLAATIYSGIVTNMVTRQVAGQYQLEATLATELYPTHTRNLNHQAVSTFNTVSQFNNAIATSTEITDADNSWTAAEYANSNFDNTAFDAQWGAQRVYDYWKTRHGRLSWDNANGVLNLFVHGDVNWDNAFWQGGGGINSMFYGDGSNVAGGFSSLTSLDVTGHEIGHGVCQSTANLTYNRESGAMNEGFSDIWGASIEHFGDPHEVDAVAKSYFLLGEEITIGGGALRSMSSPKTYGQPDTYLGTNWQVTTTTGCPTPNNSNDECGVHTNSGVLNHWFYLLVSGGSGTNDLGNSYSVPGIDWVKAELITFAAEQSLTSSADYSACRSATISQATTLYGACSLETEAVTRAWYAVGVGADFVPCTPQISFAGTATVVSETAAAPGCNASKTINIPLKISSAATGGNATATISITGGTATNGVDYTVNNSTVTFAANDASNQNIVLTINDDGNIEPTENIVLHLASVAANGSNATKANVFLDYTVNITDDDKPEEVGGTETHALGVAPYVVSNLTSPFRSDSKRGRSQFIITAAELTAFGVRPNVPISNLSVNVTTKNSTIPFTGFTISMANTASADVSTAFVPEALTQVYNGNYSTVTGVNNFALSPTFTWDGTSNIVIQTCFGNSAAGSANDQVQGYSWQYSGAPTAPSYSKTGAASTGCTKAFVALNTLTRPLFTFTQNVTPTAIESTLSSTRDWSVNETNSTVNFYATSDGKLIAKLKNNSASLGCVNAQLVDAGNTWPSFLGGTRSQKAIKITPSTNIASTSYNVTLYYSVAEMGGKNPSTVNLCKTTASTIAGATSSNSVIVTPTLVTNSDGSWYSFSANFTGFSTFFLVNQVVLPVTLTNFTATKNADDNVNITWEVEQQQNIKNYIVERSTDQVTFSAIGTVAANTLSSASYHFIDTKPGAGITYYRLRFINDNGSFSYSKIANVNLLTKTKLWVVPNPVNGIFTIHFTNTTTIKQINITDAAGKIIKEINPSGSNGNVSVDATAFAKGIYFINITDAENNHTTQKIIKQ